MVLSPTRELAIQIAEQFEALGSGVGVKCAVLVGGIDMMAQAIALGKRPHVIVGTPGRVVDHLSNTKVPFCFASECEHITHVTLLDLYRRVSLCTRSLHGYLWPLSAKCLLLDTSHNAYAVWCVLANL